jgi:hypothetical protein
MQGHHARTGDGGGGGSRVRMASESEWGDVASPVRLHSQVKSGSRFRRGGGIGWREWDGICADRARRYREQRLRGN